ncbi:nucleotidyl transferase AbiEii/AbiGii toxin family protein [candidate division KSB1 bacterium]|nr:nucleotidyl transferase AbiEii/AbiGii toxin family protein [candidate division KSB1 bacterium]
MQDLQALEAFEMETLYLLNSIRVLDRLFFGGGTMLRLCHNLNRYSTDLDFWIMPKENNDIFFNQIQQTLSKSFNLTDAEEKRNTLLFEIRSRNSTRRLVIEIRKDQSDFEWERKIAFSQFSSHQIVVKGLTLKQMMQNKMNAVTSRKLIRDCFDIQFLIMKGIPLSASKRDLEKLLKILDSIKERDFKVTLGSLLNENDRNFIIQNRFQILREQIHKELITI